MDNLSPAARRKTMQRITSKDTRPEMTVRRLVHSLGYRYRLHARDLPGTPDLVFPSRDAVIFVHGCWWHGHRCRRGKREAGTNAAYWSAKRARNKARDVRVRRELRQLGWRTLVIWECRINRDDLEQRLIDFLDQ